MNIRLILHLLSSIMLVEGAAMVPSLILALIYGDGDVMAFVWSILLTVVLALPSRLFAKPTVKNLRAREGFLVVSLAWIFLSIFGALPFIFSGMIPGFVDALFEAVSGFTTTGASILTGFDNLPRGVMFWRSFTHWIGGMGVLVLTLALLPSMSSRTAHLMRAESPGPSLSKIVPKLGDSAKILYIMYGVLTLAQMLILMLAGMNAYDAAIHAMGTAGTGGFSNYGTSVAAFDSAAIDVIITFFMVLFGINFALFYRVLTGGWRDALRSEELRWYLWIFTGATVLIAIFIFPQYQSVGEALRYAGFQVASIMSTTGYATTDYNLWPAASKMIIFILMFIGSCAGSTAGGMKTIRVAVLFKHSFQEIRHTFHTRKVQVLRFDHKALDDKMVHQITSFAFIYIALFLFGALLVSFDGVHDLETNLTASLACISNIGPGLGGVGPVENFAAYSDFSKVILSLLMLAGRLELYPILMLFHPAIWRKH